MSEIEFNLDFSDRTILEADGQYDHVRHLMESEWPHSPEWMIRSDLTVDSPFGYGSMTLHLYSNKDVYVIDYSPSMGDVYYNPDIQCLSAWAQEKGWNIPKPDKGIVQRSLEFWKHFWLTGLVDSDYLTEMYGERPGFG